ncbi:MAG: methyltransferase protein [Myxococcaceae bacterium]|nr:methyltransferase protein [Myxococcaceae bacterium]
MKIGIALAAYQPVPRYFAEQLASLQAQEHEDWVCSVRFDSPSTVMTEPLLSPFVSDARFTWTENPTRLGSTKNFERAIADVVGRGAAFVACADQDDVWDREKLAVSLAALRDTPLGLVHADVRILGADGRTGAQTAWELEARNVDRAEPLDLLVRNVVTGAAMLFDAELARRFPIIPEGARFHDHWFAIVASLHGGVRPIRRALSAWRQHDTNLVGLRKFGGYFSRPNMGGGRLEGCDVAWARAEALLGAIREAKLPLAQRDEEVFTRPDLGLRLARLAARNFSVDRVLSRHCLALAIGKARASRSE